jgi:glycerophosphoryl diester phosphodiesterase
MSLRTLAVGLLCALPLAAQQAAPTLQAYPFTVHYPPAAQRLAMRVLAMAQADSLPGIANSLWRDQPISIFLAPTEEAFQVAVGGRVPEWGAGVAIPERGLIVLPAWGSTNRGGSLDYGTVLRHELAHLAVQRAATPARVPRWFDEGYATWAAGELDWNRAWLLRIAFLTGRAPPLDSLTLDWPRGAARAQLAYLLSATVVEYLVDQSGTFGLQRVLERARLGGSFEQALIDTYGVDTGTLEAQWRRFVKRRYGWTVVLTQSIVFGGLLGIIVLVLFLLRRRRDLRKLAMLRASELPEAPVFWHEGGVEIIAHRGYSARAPENTMPAMELAMRAGAGALEFDVHASADGVPVVIHDYELGRTTNGAGRVALHTVEQLHALDAGSWYHEQYTGTPVPTLAELLHAVAGRVNRVYVELKPRAFTVEQVDTLLQVIEQCNFTAHSTIMSFDWAQLDAVRARSPDVVLAFLADDQETFLQALERARADGRALVDCPYRLLLKNRELAVFARNLGIELAVYTVNETDEASALAALGVQRITTNEVEKLLKWAAGRSAGWGHS